MNDRTRKNYLDDKYKAVSSVLIRPEDGKPYRSRHQERNAAMPQEKGLVKEFEKEVERLGVLFNGMQGRSNDQLPVALFTDKKTKSTFGVEPGQSVKSKLNETRKRFRFVRDQF